MKLQLSPTFETFLLLSASAWGKKQKKQAIAQLDDFGINGTAFYAANFPVMERYFAAFASRLVETEGSDMVREMCDEMVIAISAFLLLHPQWVNNFDAVSSEEVTAATHEGIACLLERDREQGTGTCSRKLNRGQAPVRATHGESNLLDALEASELSDQAKWQIAALLRQPKQKLLPVVEAINANLPAFEYAFERIAPEIAPLLRQLEKQQEKGTLPPTIDAVAALQPQAQIIPSLAAALMVMIAGDHCIIGLLLSKLLAGQDENLTEAEATLIAKSLSDTSKLRILQMLKNGKHYNLEIAQEVGLTPATTSHHMNMLLAAGLVEVSKKHGKVYYGLCVEGVKRYCAWLGDNLL